MKLLIYFVIFSFSQGVFAQKMSTKPVKNISIGLARTFLTKSTGESIRRTQLSVSHFGFLPHNFTYEGEFYFIPDFSQQTGQVIVKESHYALNAFSGYAFTYLFRFRPALGLGGMVERVDQDIASEKRVDHIWGLQVMAKLNIDYAVTNHVEVSLEGGSRYRVHWKTFDGFFGIRVGYNF